VQTTVYPLYAFEDQSGKGDYYIIDQVITNPNADWYELQTFSHSAGFKNHVAAWYRKRFQINNTIQAGNGYTVTINDTTHPDTTVNKTTYTKGMTWNIGGSITGGTQNGDPLVTATVTAGATFSNTETREISDLDIENLRSGNTASWALQFNNLASAHHDNVNPPASSARASVELATTWVWRVEGTQNNDKTSSFIMTVDIPQDKNIWQGFWVWGSGPVRTASGSKDITAVFSTTPPETSLSFILTPPNRTPTTNLKITNNSSEYISEIKIWKSGTATTANPDFTLSGKTIPPNGATDMWLPTESGYKVQFKAGSNLYHSQANGFDLSRRGEEVDVYFATNSPHFVSGGF
jgi:hypothetical protein